MPEPQTEAALATALRVTLRPEETAREAVAELVAAYEAGRDAALADIAMRVETEWYNGNVSEGARDRILKGLSRPDLNNV